MNWLKDKTVLVTGATGGLGRPLCRAFADRGCTVMGADLAAAVADHLAVNGVEANTNAGANHHSPQPGFEPSKTKVPASSQPWSQLYPLDVTDPADWQHLYDQTGDVDVLIHNAGITALDCFREGGSQMVQKVMAVNFFGAVYGTGAYLDGLRARSGRIAVLSSVAGFAPLFGRTAYCSSKHALHGFFASLQAEERDCHLRVTLVSPSFIATGIRQNAEAAAAGGKLDQKHELSPDFVADRIAAAVNRGQRRLRLGKTAHAAWWLNFLLPAVYEKLMIRTAAKD